MASRGGEKSRPIRFERVEQKRAHEYVAEQIRRQIILKLIPAGKALPPERELAAMFGVARATVQRAVRILVEDGLVESRRGRGGGNFVLGPGEARAEMGQLLARLRRQRPQVEEALTYRRAVEPAAAAEAADSRSRADLRTLEAANSAAEGAPTDAEFVQADAEFHFALATAARNRYFQEAIERIRMALSDAIVALPESHLWRERTLIEHEAILAAIAGRDASAAAAAMEVHVLHTERSVEALLAALKRRRATSEGRG